MLPTGSGSEPPLLIDDPEEQSRFTEFSSPDATDASTPTARSFLRVAGMTCSACADNIEAALSSCEGVQSAHVWASTGRAEVVWTPGQSKPSVWIASVERAGYRAAPDTAAHAHALRQAETRQAWWRLFVAGMCMMQVMMMAAPSYFTEPGEIEREWLDLLNWGSWLLSLPVLFFSAGPFFQQAWQGLKRREIRMDLPVAVGVLVTFLVSSAATFDPAGPLGHEVYFDSMTMFVFFLLGGRTLEMYARHRVAALLEGYADRMPEAVERVQGETHEWVAPRHLRQGDCIRIYPGNAIVADGVVRRGHSEVDEALMTGEARPVSKQEGDAVLAGSLNLSGVLLIEVSRLGPQTRWSQIQDLMRSALRDRPAFTSAAHKIAGPFLVMILLLSASAAGVWWWIDPSKAWWVAVSVLIVTCPCALGLAAPAALLSSAAALARRGVWLRRLEALESLASVDTVVLDKTGTVTLPGQQLLWSVGDVSSARQALALARLSRHPVSLALVASRAGLLTDSVQSTPEGAAWQELREVPGMGMEGRDEAGRRWRLGRPRWADAQFAERWGQGSVGHAAPEGMSQLNQASVVLSLDGVACWAAEYGEQLRHDAPCTVATLQRAGCQVRLLSGDTSRRVRSTAELLGLQQWTAEATPQEKLSQVFELQKENKRVLMVGDGLNDAPVLARADVSLAFVHGAALSQHHADGLLLTQDLAGVSEILSLAKTTRRIIRQNMGWSVVYNLACIPIALMGYLPPWAAGLGMALSSLGVVLNSLRLSRWKPRKT